MNPKILIASVLVLSSSLFGALTEEQRVQDFQALTGLYAKSYGPANWKILALSVNIFDTATWTKRVRAAKSDLEHVQILFEYVASLKDTHTSLGLKSNFLADLGFYCDLYDGKVLIDTLDRSIIPTAQYPFIVGDEFVSLDGRPAIEVARELEKVLGWGNPRAQTRFAIQGVTLRYQAWYPLAVDVPAESTVVIRRQSGTLETYKIKWAKSGYPVRNLGTLGTPSALSSVADTLEVERIEASVLSDRPARQAIVENYQGTFKALVNPRSQRPTLNEDGEGVAFQAVRGFGAAAPRWTPPAGFQLRLGRSAADFFYSGTYVSDGMRIGYLRARNFSFYTNAGLNQLANELIYMANNTDGMVVDMMLNNGGSVCAATEMAAMLIPERLTVPGASFRPTVTVVQAYDSALLEAEDFQDPQYVIDTIRFQRDLMIGSSSNGRGMTGSIVPCFYTDANQESYSFAYRKPLIVLTDDFSTSAADLLPAMMQDNHRGKLVGTRTNGAGGYVNSLSQATPWSELDATFAGTVVIRSEEHTYEGFVKSPFIENVGVRPDVELDYMTQDNLLNGGRSFVAAFTKIIVDEIRASRP